MTNGNKKRTEATQAAILDAAERVFLDKGYDGGSLSAIAKLAGVNQSLIAHHFGSKAGLWEAAWTRLYQRYFEQQHRQLERPKEEEPEILRDSVKAYFYHLKQTPDAVRMQSWTFLGRRSKPFPIAHDLVKKGLERLREAQKKGLIRDDVPAEFVWASFISIIHHWFELRDEYEEILQSSLQPDEDLDEAYLDAMLKIFLEGAGGKKE